MDGAVMMPGRGCPHHQGASFQSDNAYESSLFIDRPMGCILLVNPIFFRPVVWKNFIRMRFFHTTGFSILHVATRDVPGFVHYFYRLAA
jgi:hypothetical protein